MYFLYIILNFFIYCIGLALLPLSLFSKKHNLIYQKFFPLQKCAQADIHFHFASFGEAKTMRPLIEFYKNQNKKIIITTASKTGLAEAKKICENSYLLPLEIVLFFWLKPAKNLVIFEAELWLNLIKLYKFHGKNTILLNARIKPTREKKYRKLAFFYREIYSQFDLILTISAEHSTRIKSICKAAKTIDFCNIKITQIPKITQNYPKINRPILLIASTHEGEEELIIKQLDVKFLQDFCIIFAPRHPERFEKIAKITQEFALQLEQICPSNCQKTFSRFSLNANDYQISRVFLLDTLGELVNFYAIADYVILGGSYVKIGGHNFAEVAHFGCKITAGTHIESQKEVLQNCENIVINDKIELKNLKNSSIKSAYTFQKLCDILQNYLKF